MQVLVRITYKGPAECRPMLLPVLFVDLRMGPTSGRIAGNGARSTGHAGCRAATNVAPSPQDDGNGSDTTRTANATRNGGSHAPFGDLAATVNLNGEKGARKTHVRPFRPVCIVRLGPESRHYVVQYSFRCNYPSAPGSHKFRPHSGRCGSDSGPKFVEFGPKFGRNRPQLAKLDPTSAQNWPKFSRIRPDLVESGQY